jgi:hypothetical protein
MNVLADAAEVRIVVLGNERDSQRPREIAEPSKELTRGASLIALARLLVLTEAA